MDPKKETMNEEELKARSAQEEQEGKCKEENAANGQAAEETNEPNELEKLQAEMDEMKDKYLRLSAEFDNYRKRTMKEKAELILNGGEKSISSILPIPSWTTSNAR